VTKLEAYRFVEQFLDGVAARGETLAEARRKVSAHILMYELHEINPDLSTDKVVEAGLKFHEGELKMNFADVVDRGLEAAKQAARTPLPINNQVTDSQAIGDLIQSYKRAGKPKAYDPNDDPEIIARVKHTMRPKEKLTQWFARTLIGRAAILQMSRAEISEAVARAEANSTEDWVFSDAPNFEPKRLPAKFVLDTFE
jgi:hypothetical protein